MYYSYAIIYSLLFLHQYNMYNVGTIVHVGFSGGSVVKNPPANAGDSGSISGWGRSAEEGNGNSLQHSCLENPMDRGAQQATVHGISQSMTERLKQQQKMFYNSGT